ncbi:MAG: hypothetical protein NT040_11750 [Bacteroidetes bacterium]|nr:hypothetical protein [Bacteroidota bacterium]
MEKRLATSLVIRQTSPDPLNRSRMKNITENSTVGGITDEGLRLH